LVNWLAFVLLSAFWGSSYLFIRIGIRDLTPLALVSLRLTIGALVIMAISLARRQPMRLPPGAFPLLVLLATINTTIPFLLISWGEVSVPSGLASVLNSTVPIFSVLIAGAVLHDEPVTIPKIGGVVIGFAGVILLLSRDLAHSSFVVSSLVGQAAIVLASICYAVGAVFARRTFRDLPPLTIATYVVAISAVQSTALSLLFSPPHLLSIRPSALFAVMWLGLLGTGLAYSLSYFILANWGASRYTLIAYMLPITGLTLGAIVLHEALDWRIIAGSILVVAGVGLASVVRRPEAEMPAPARSSPVG
jgi:drug/metabolite transporter (DMT)-like permease